MVTQVAQLAPEVVAVLLVLAQVLAHEVGLVVGRLRKPGHGSKSENVKLIVTTILSLLAFMMALTLTFATTRFEERRVAVVAEANAIGTARLRALAIGSPDALHLAGLLVTYASARASFVNADRKDEAIDRAAQTTTQLQDAIWQEVKKITRVRTDPVATSLMASVNEAFDASSMERMALATLLPDSIVYLLALMVALSAYTLGYFFGLRGDPPRILMVVLMAIWATVTVIIVDLASPRVGSIRTNVSPYQWAVQGG